MSLQVLELHPGSRCECECECWFVSINWQLVQGVTLPPPSDSWGGTPATLSEGEAGMENGWMEIRGKQLHETRFSTKKRKQ